MGRLAVDLHLVLDQLHPLERVLLGLANHHDAVNHGPYETLVHISKRIIVLLFLPVISNELMTESVSSSLFTAIPDKGSLP